MSKPMKIGYIAKINDTDKKWEFREATFTRKINSRGDKVYSKMLLYPVDYEEIVDTANEMKEHPEIMVVREPFLLDDELRDKAARWVEWANSVPEYEYDPFAIRSDE